MKAEEDPGCLGEAQLFEYHVVSALNAAALDQKPE